MARGWESKAVEDQQHEAEARQAASSAAVTTDPARETQRQALMLARTRALADLQLACRPTHRAMLEGAIRDLETKLSTLS